MFNEWIIFSLIYALASPVPTEIGGKSYKNKKGSSSKCVIVTKTEGKKLVWIKFFQNFLPDVLCMDTRTITKDVCKYLFL